jgi:protein-ribulosamine 3-kinase
VTRAALVAAAGAALGRGVALDSVAAAAGGCINDCYLVGAGKARLFVKLNTLRFADAFAAEADGLAALRAAGMRAPEPLAHGAAAGCAFLALEALDLGGKEDFAAFGHALARLHRVRGDRFGWTRDNFIGATAQPNSRTGDWIEFWRDQRLAPQLKLALRNGHGEVKLPVERICKELPQLLAGHSPEPSLLHGDLWRGNVGFLAGGGPVVFDPALYRGDREADLAMTELFGGFPRAFYAAYEEAWPLEEGYRARKHLYNLYHLLNHLNLFGAGYLAQVRETLGLLLRGL